MSFPSDLDIARSVTPRPIGDIAAGLGLRPDEIEHYGPTKAKVTLAGVERVERERPRGKYVVVTAITPTPLGEGKTTTTVGPGPGPQPDRAQRRGGDPPALARPGLRDQGRRRRRRLQPGRPDGGLQPPPDRRHPRHQRGPQPRRGLPRQPPPPRQRARHRPVLDPLAARRRHQRPGDPRGPSSAWAARRTAFPRETEWVITVASEVMAILALARDLFDLRARLGRIVVATSRDGKAVTTEDLGVAGAMTVLLRDAIKPNLLQTLEGGPAFVHCGPFANIAHGNSSIIADRVALSTSRHRGDRGRLRRRHGRPRSSSTSSAAPRACGRMPRSSWPPCARSRCTAASAGSWPASRSIRRSRRRTSTPSAPARRTSRSTSRSWAPTGSRWSWR